MAGRDSPVREFEKCVWSLVRWLGERPTLNTLERLSLENHLQAIYLAYSAWKRRETSPEYVEPTHPDN